MSRNDADILLEYLKGILYSSEVQTPDLNSLEEPCRSLGEELRVLQGWVEEMRAYSEDLSLGNISVPYPSQDNPLCVNLRHLQASLKHLSWQAGQVAAGDYSQKVTYPGEFAAAFNTMISQLKERESYLTEEKNQAEKEAEIIKSYNVLLLELIRRQNKWILVVDPETKEIIYCNKRQPGQEENQDSKFCDMCRNRLPFRNKILNWETNNQNNVWEIGDGEDHYYKATTFPIEWRNRYANAYILVDITEEKAETTSLKDKAYHDALTGIHNRVYFEECIETMLSEKDELTLGYLDLDCLKTVNDQYGHAEGDAYILKFVSVVQKYFRTTDIFCRIGGDEFCLVLRDTPKEVVAEKLQKAMEEFQGFQDKEYIHGFSFGVVQVNGREEIRSLKEIIKEADSAMYRCKRRNKVLYRERQEAGRT